MSPEDASPAKGKRKRIYWLKPNCKSVGHVACPEKAVLQIMKGKARKWYQRVALVNHRKGGSAPLSQVSKPRVAAMPASF